AARRGGPGADRDQGRARRRPASARGARRGAASARRRALDHRERADDGARLVAPAAPGAARRPLPAAVEWYLRGFGARHDVRAELLHDRMDERFTPDIEASIYRIVQEALTNVAKHARATTCRVYLQRLPHTILITVEY